MTKLESTSNDSILNRGVPIFLEFIKHHDPNRNLEFFCANQACSNCELGARCAPSDVGLRPRLSKAQIRYIRTIHPEYFI